MTLTTQKITKVELITERDVYELINVINHKIRASRDVNVLDVKISQRMELGGSLASEYYMRPSAWMAIITWGVIQDEY